LVDRALGARGLEALLVLLGVLILLVATQERLTARHIETLSPAVETATSWKAWLDVALPLLLVGGFHIVLNHTDLLMVGALLGPVDAGVYGAAMKTATLISFFLIAVNTVAAPAISSLYFREEHENLQRMLYAIAHWTFWPTLVTAVGVLALAGLVLSLFGSGFSEPGSTPLRVLVIGHLINAACGPVAYILNVTGEQKKTAAVFGTSAVLNVLLNAALIPRFGIVGASAATASTMALWNIWLVWLVWKHRSLKTTVFSALRWRGR
jgi:O-antigen/teichoic acid export membrane protein